MVFRDFGGGLKYHSEYYKRSMQRDIYLMNVPQCQSANEKHLSDGVVQSINYDTSLIH